MGNLDRCLWGLSLQDISEPSDDWELSNPSPLRAGRLHKVDSGR